VQILLALHHCHHSFFGEWSLLHRDIKPENGEALTLSHLPSPIRSLLAVLFSGNGTVKLGDFGLSKILEASQQQAISFVGVRIGSPLKALNPINRQLTNMYLIDPRLSCSCGSVAGRICKMIPHDWL
jgi:serine/threonine protein kinase